MIEQSEDSTNISILSLAEELGTCLDSAGLCITTAESCTGGLIAGAITEVAGSSGWFRHGVVTYSNEAKQTLLGVAASVFEQHGAVSEACVRRMAEGALQRSGADVAVSVSGIAGPGGATADKPVGTVWIGWAVRSRDTVDTDKSHERPNQDVKVDAREFLFSGDRRLVRRLAVIEALRGTISIIDNVGMPK